jgi:hypothetical protein
MAGVSRKHIKWWAVIFLPIVLRALIPVGFMPMFGPGFSVRLVVCDSYAPVPWAITLAMSMDMRGDMPMDAVTGSSSSHHGHPVHEDHATCPYGSGPALGALPSLAKLPLLLERPIEPAIATAQLPYFQVSFRAQSPRGPPA